VDKDKIFLDSTVAFKEETNLYHYTTFDGLKKIINNKRFRLTRIDQISDPLEVKYLDRIWKERTYIGCFTNSNENEQMWQHYTEGNTGVCINFGKVDISGLKFYDEDNNEYEKINETDYQYSSFNRTTDFRIKSVSGLKVIYVNNPEYLAIPNHDLISFFEGVQDVNDRDGFYNHPFQGYVKESRLFNFEQEFRIRVALLPKGNGTKLTIRGQIFHAPPTKYIYMEVDINTLKVFVKKENPFLEEITNFCNQSDLEIETLKV
jgi:hypothetical protein